MSAQSYKKILIYDGETAPSWAVDSDGDFITDGSLFQQLGPGMANIASIGFGAWQILLEIQVFYAPAYPLPVSDQLSAQITVAC